VTIRRATDVAALDAFYALHVRTRRHQGVPTQPRRFIRGFTGLFDAGLGHVLLAEWEGEVIAAAVFLRAGTTVLYKYGASAREHLDKRPNNLLFSEAIRMACAEGARALDMGRTDLDNEGLRAFKLAWGAEEREIAYTRLSAKPVKAGGGAAVKAGGGVPATASRLISSGPPVFGRLVGEALYRHYG
jgi:lipid II:glycine glycyltransferase (peptidoglycan interpeptide bridge formation enzyme)